MSTPADTHARLTALADRLARLRPDWRSAERFYEERSEMRAELRAIANSPVALRTVTKFVRIQPEPPPPPITAPEIPAPPAGSLPLILTPQEREVLRHATTTTTGGFASSFKRWHRTVDPNTGVLVLMPYDVARVWGWGSRPWKGGAQNYAHKIFWRSVGVLFSSLGMSPETGEVVTRPNPHRRHGKKDRPENTGDTPPQDAPDGPGLR